MNRTTGKPLAVSKCIMLAICAICAVSVLMMSGCQTQGATDGSQNTQGSVSNGKTAGVVKGNARRFYEEHLRLSGRRDYRELLGNVVSILHQGDARFAADKGELP